MSSKDKRTVPLSSGLRHTFAHEQYNKFIEQGYSDFMARKKVSELLGHHRDDVTRIYLSGGDV